MAAGAIRVSAGTGVIGLDSSHCVSLDSGASDCDVAALVANTAALEAESLPAFEPEDVSDIRAVEEKETGLQGLNSFKPAVFPCFSWASKPAKRAIGAALAGVVVALTASRAFISWFATTDGGAWSSAKIADASVPVLLAVLAGGLAGSSPCDTADLGADVSGLAAEPDVAANRP